MPTPKPEKNEIATTLDGRDITRGYLSPLLLEPPDDTVLMARGAGDYSLYREVLRDDHVKAALTQRIQSVISRPWEVKAGGKRAIDQAAAEFLREQIAALRWDDITAKMLHGVFYGHAVAEVMWGVAGKYVSLADIKVRDRRRFGYDGAGRLRLKTLANYHGELLPERKFWIFATGADHDDAPYGLGLAHWLYWPVWLKRNGIRFWSVFLEKFGTPTAVGKFPPGSSPEDQSKLLAALQAIQRDSAIIFPDGMQAELLEATRGGTADHAAFTQLMNAAILVITIGQTASTQGTPGKLGNDQEQADVRADITQADADLVCMSFNASVARWLTEFNFPGATPPRVWRVMDEPEDLNALAERDERLARVGYKPGLARVTEVYGEGYEPAAPLTLPSPPRGGQGEGATPPPAPAFAEGAPFPDQAALDAAIDALDAAMLNAQARALLKPILDKLAGGADPTELLGWLAEAYPGMDADALTETLERMLFVAQVWGRLSADA
jgi:phage gp29-like protein